MARPISARLAAYLDAIEYARKEGYPWADILPPVQNEIPELRTVSALKQAVIRARNRRDSRAIDPEQRALPSLTDTSASAAARPAAPHKPAKPADNPKPTPEKKAGRGFSFDDD